MFEDLGHNASDDLPVRAWMVCRQAFDSADWLVRADGTIWHVV
jgi:hypothetical protein